MNNDDYMTPKGRTHNFITADNVLTPNPIHIFTNPNVLSPPISALKVQCQRRNIPVEIYSDANELSGLVGRLKQKALIVIETPRISATEVSWVFPQKFAFPKPGDNIKIVTFPGKVSVASYEQAKEKNDVLAVYDKLFGIVKQSSKIKLRKVHSSKDIKYELASHQDIKQTKAGKEVFFQKLLYSDYKVQPDSEFRLLTDSIKNTPNTFACLNFNDLKIAVESMEIKTSKLLFLVDEKGLKDWREYVQKSKLAQRVQFMVLGDLKPNKELLKSNVYFASDNGQEILNELQKLKFQQVERCRSEFIRLTTSHKNQFKFSEQSIKIQPYSSANFNSPQKKVRQPQQYSNRANDWPELHRMSEQFSASIFSNASSQFQRYMRNWTVDIDPSAKDRKNAQFILLEEEGKQHIEGPSEPMSKRASRITGRRNSSESSEEVYSYTVNNLVDEYQRMKKKDASNSTVNIPVPIDLQFNNLHKSHKEITSPTKIASSTTVIQQKSGSRKIIQIMKKTSNGDKHQTKHQQMPSNVIQQTSQEYRGSNRESIVNMDDHFYHYSQGQVNGSGNNIGGSAGNVSSGNFSKVKNTALGPAEQAGMRRTVHQGPTYPAQNRITNIGYDSPSKQQLPIDSPSNSEVKMKERLIDGLTGELIGNYNSKYQPIDYVNEKVNKKMHETITVAPYQSESQTITVIASPSSNKGHQQILRPSHYIEPQIVKIPNSSVSLREGSKESIATQKKMVVQYNAVSVNNIQSTTSITDTFGGNSNNTKSNNMQVISSPRNAGYTTTTYANQNNRAAYINSSANINNNIIISGERAHSPSVNYSNTPATTTNYASSGNYKVYTPEEYAARYQNGANTIRTATDNNRVNYSTSYPTGYVNQQNNNYSTREYVTNQNYTTTPQTYTTSTVNNYQTSNYNTSQKQPQVIKRVYIKASDLPQSNYNHYATTKRYQTSPNHYTTQDYKAKLSIQDNDPFNQLTPSKQSAMRKGSYLKRKEDGKRDPYSPYEENTSQLLANQKSGVKVYTSEEYQKVVQNRKYTSPVKDSNTFDLNNYDRVMQNGIAVYKPKNIINTITTKVQTNTIEPNRDNYHQSKVTVVNGYKSGGITRYEPTGRDYANSPTRREGSSYEKSLRTDNPLRRPSQETYEARNMAEVSKNVMPLREQRVTPLVYDSKSPMKVTEYRSGETKNSNLYTYNSPTRHTYQRRQMMQPRVQASNFNDRVNNKLPQNQIGIISGIHKNSQIFELSDGSIMRRNNIKFGINKYRGGNVANKMDDEFEYLGQMKSRIQSKVINLSEMNRNNFVEKKLANEQQVLNEKQAYSYINTSVNEFYFLLDDELTHVSTWISKYLKSRNDKIQSFRGMDQLYEKIQVQKDNQEFDVTFVFLKNQDMPKINKRLLPQNCFIVEILTQDFRGLQVSQKQQHIKLTKLPFLKLAQKIIIETMLTHIILYQRTATIQTEAQYFNKQVSHILSLFPEGQFIKEPYDSPLSLQMINTLIDDPKFNRLYIICNEKQMTNVVDQLSRVSQESGIPEEICKIICIPQDNQILRHQEKIESYPRVAWMTNSSKIKDYKSLIKYALRQEEDDNLYTKQQSQQKEKIFYHTRHRNLNNMIEKEFPQRFQFEAFNSLGEVQKKILKTKTQKVKDTYSPKKPTQQKSKPSLTTINYLILHPILNDEYIDTKLFKKIFMLGKSDKTQRKVMKVGSNEELIELLKR